MRGWVKALLILFVMPILVGGVVLLVAGRPIAFHYPPVANRLKGAVRIDPYRPSLRPLQGLGKDTPVMVYSSAGYRGARVASWLEKAGYTNVQNLAGGIFAWTNEGRPIFRGDTPTAVVHPYNQNWGRLVDDKYRAEASAVQKQSAAP